jgi:hypothetical protein
VIWTGCFNEGLQDEIPMWLMTFHLATPIKPLTPLAYARCLAVRINERIERAEIGQSESDSRQFAP